MECGGVSIALYPNRWFWERRKFKVLAKELEGFSKEDITKENKKREAAPVNYTAPQEWNMHTHIKEPTTDYKISKDNTDKIKSFLGIILKEVWLIKRREGLSEVGEENLRIIGREAGFIADLLE